VTSENRPLQFKNNQQEVQFSVPVRIIHSLKKEFNIQDDREANDFIITLIEKSIADHTAESNSGAFSETETKEIEEDLKGLGYI
jgi:hypothetical protein